MRDHDDPFTVSERSLHEHLCGVADAVLLLIRDQRQVLLFDVACGECFGTTDPNGQLRTVAPTLCVGDGRADSVLTADRGGELAFRRRRRGRDCAVLGVDDRFHELPVQVVRAQESGDDFEFRADDCLAVDVGCYRLDVEWVALSYE